MADIYATCDHCGAYLSRYGTCPQCDNTARNTRRIADALERIATAIEAQRDVNDYLLSTMTAKPTVDDTEHKR